MSLDHLRGPDFVIIADQERKSSTWNINRYIHSNIIIKGFFEIIISCGRLIWLAILLINHLRIWYCRDYLAKLQNNLLQYTYNWCDQYNTGPNLYKDVFGGGGEVGFSCLLMICVSSIYSSDT